MHYVSLRGLLAPELSITCRIRRNRLVGERSRVLSVGNGSPNLLQTESKASA